MKGLKGLKRIAFVSAAAVLLVFLAAGPALAQDEGGGVSGVAEVVTNLDAAWVLVAAALVFFMQAGFFFLDDEELWWFSPAGIWSSSCRPASSFWRAALPGR